MDASQFVVACIKEEPCDIGPDGQEHQHADIKPSVAHHLATETMLSGMSGNMVRGW